MYECLLDDQGCWKFSWPCAGSEELGNGLLFESGKWCVMLAMIRSVRAIMINPGRIDQTDSFLKLHSPVSKFTWWKCLWRDPILSCRRLQNHMVWFIPICKVQWKCSWTFHDFHHVVKFRPRPALVKFGHFNLKTLIQHLIDGLNSHRDGSAGDTHPWIQYGSRF